jgi:hypothetical protein
MDEKASGLIRRGQGNGHGDGHSDIARLTHDIDSIRGNLDDLIDELDRRRRRAMNLKLQARSHPVSFVLGTVAVLGLVTAAIAFGITQHRRRARISFRARRIGRNVAHVLNAVQKDGAGRRVGRLGLRLLAAGGKLTVAAAARSLRGRRGARR